MLPLLQKQTIIVGLFFYIKRIGKHSLYPLGFSGLLSLLP